MPYSSGTYTFPTNSWNPAVASTTISATDWNSTRSDMATAFSTCLLKDGSQTATASIPFAAGLSAGGAFVVNSSGDLAVTTNKFTIAASSGNTLIAGTLAVTGAQTFTGAATFGAATGFSCLPSDSNSTLTVGTFRNASNGNAAATGVNWGNDTGSNQVTVRLYGSAHATLPSIFDITHQGNFSITRGTNGTLRETLSNAGAFRWHAYGAGTLTTDASGNITAVSDERLKANTRAFPRGIEAIMALEPILHGYTKESGLDQSKDDYAGFSAQNVQTAIPEAVGKNPDQVDKSGKLISRGMLTVQDRGIMAAVVNAIKNHETRLVALGG